MMASCNNSQFSWSSKNVKLSRI